MQCDLFTLQFLLSCCLKGFKMSPGLRCRENTTCLCHSISALPCSALAARNGFLSLPLQISTGHWHNYWLLGALKFFYYLGPWLDIAVKELHNMCLAACSIVLTLPNLQDQRKWSHRKEGEVNAKVIRLWREKACLCRHMCVHNCYYVLYTHGESARLYECWTIHSFVTLSALIVARPILHDEWQWVVRTN